MTIERRVENMEKRINLDIKLSMDSTFCLTIDEDSEYIRSIGGLSIEEAKEEILKSLGESIEELELDFPKEFSKKNEFSELIQKTKYTVSVEENKDKPYANN